MAGNEYFFDPFFSEEEDIREKQKRALGIALRGTPTREMGDYTSRINDITEQVNAQREMAEIPAMREALSRKYRESLIRALSGESPEIQRLGSEPTTAPLAVKQVSERLERENIAREREAIRARMSQGQVGVGGQGPDAMLAYQVALEEAQHPNPKIHGPAKVLLESLKSIDPKNSAMRDPSGRMITVPGAPEAITAQQNAFGDMVEIEMGDGSKQRVPKSQAIEFLLKGARLVGPAPQVNAPTGPVASPGSPTYPGSSPPVASPTGPVTPPSGPVSGPPNTPPGANAYPMQVSPADQLKRDLTSLDILKQERSTALPEDYAMYDKAIAERERRIAMLQQKVNASPTDYTLPPSGAVRPTGPVGSTPSKADLDAYANVKQENEKALQAWSNKSNVSDLKMSLDRLKELNQQPMYSGYYEAPMALENTISALTLGKVGKSDEGKNIEKFEKSSGDIIAGLLPQYGSGNGISDADMRGAQMRVANARMDPESRAEVIAVMEDKVAFAEYANQRVPVLVRQNNYTLAAAKDIAFMEYEKMKQQRAAAEKAQKAAPGTVPSGPRGPEGQSGSMRNPASPLSQTIDAVTDVAKNTGRGAMNLFGFGDRQAAVADVERQEARAESEPIYGGARTIADFGKYAPAMAFGPLGGALVAGGIAAAQPSTTSMGQIVSGTTSAAGGAVLGKVMNLIRGLPVTQQIQALEDQIARMAPRAAGRAALQREVDALKLQIERLGGTVSDLPGQAFEMVSSPLRGVLNVLRGR